MIRLATHVGGYSGCDTVSPGGPLILNASERVFDDPNQNVRVEWLADLGGAGARVRIGPSRGVAQP